MQSLIFGLIAALAWGIHDLMVRHLSQRAPVAPLLVSVLLAGCLLLIPLSLIGDGWSRMTTTATLYALASGVCLVIGSVGLYRGLAIGPVRLVAPIVGAYPVVYVAVGAVTGQALALGQWLAVLAVAGGIALVARQPGDTAPPADRPAAIGWSALSAIGFALTFALGQIATREGADLPAILIARLCALTLVAAYVLARRLPLQAARHHAPLLLLTGALDVTALGVVIAAGGLPNPEYATVASSAFGAVTILLAWRFLHEPMRAVQWVGVACVFSGIAWLAAQ